MGKIRVTETGTTVAVDNDTVILDIPGGGNVRIQANSRQTQKVKIEFVDDSHSDMAIIDLSTFSQNELHIDIRDYDPSDHIKLLGAYDYYVDPNNPDEFTFKYVGADGQEYTGFIRAKDKNESNFLDNPPPIIICFTPGTRIATPRGEVPVQHLEVGDLVITADRGLQAIRWIGAKRISGARLMAYPNLRPIRIRKNALGDGIPEQDMWVSPQHRMLIRSARLALEYGDTEALVPAKALLNDQSITVDYGLRQTEYIHILFDHHEIIFANGALTESFHPGATVLNTMEVEARKELFEIFPELGIEPGSFGPSARASLRVSDARRLRLG